MDMSDYIPLNMMFVTNYPSHISVSEIFIIKTKGFYT